MKFNASAEFLGPVTARWFKLNTTPGSYTPAEGVMIWESNYDTLAIHNDASSNPLLVGQQMRIRVYNNTGLAIASGKIVSSNGMDPSFFPYIRLTDVTDPAHRETFLGVVANDIPNASYGYVITKGIVDNVDFSAFSAGDSVWASETETGGFQITEPTGSVIRIGTILEGTITGAMLVDIGVALTGTTILPSTYGPVADQWIDSYDATTGLFTSSTIALNNLSDVFVSSPVDRHVLIYDGATDNRWEHRLLVEADISDLQAYLLTTDLPDVWRKSDQVTKATTYTEQIHHNGNVVLNGVTKDAAYSNAFGSTLIVGNLGIQGGQIQNENVTGWLNVRGNQGIRIQQINQNVGWVQLGNDSLAEMTGDQVGDYNVNVSRSWTTSVSQVSNPNWINMRLMGSVNYTQGVGSGTFTSLYIAPTLTAVSEHIGIDTSGDIRFRDYPNSRDDGTPTNFLGTDASGNVISAPTSDLTAGFTTNWIGLTDTDPTTYVGSAGHLVRVNSTPDGLEFVDGETLFIPISERAPFRETVSTGIVSGGALSINVDTTKFDVAAGKGYIVDHTVDPPVITTVSFGPFTAQTVTNLATSFATDIAIDINGNIVQQNSFTAEELRSNILLGGLDHANKTNIVGVFAIQKPMNAPASNIAELARAVGDINVSGNVYNANGVNLNIDKSGGTVFSYGRNNVNNENDPSTITNSSQVALSFGYVFNDGAGNGSFSAQTTSINPNNYDNGTGTLATVPVNRYTIQRLLFFPNGEKTFVQYGTETFILQNDALNAVARADFPALTGIRTAMVRGYLVVRQGETDLTSTDTVFLSADRFGTVAGLSSGSSATSWGDITGTLANQTDLQSALDAKEDIVNKGAANGYVPLDGTTKILETYLPEVVNFDSVQFNGGTGSQGLVSWNTDEWTLDLIQNGTILQLGQETQYQVRNNSLVTINDGEAVMATGSIGASGRITVAKMVNDGSIAPDYFIGIATETILNDTDGKVTNFGKIRGIQTDGVNYSEAWVDGDLIYLSPTTPGALTKVKPQAPAYKAPIAMVVHSHATNGTLFVRVTGNEGVHELHDVQVTSIANLDVLRWNSTNSRYENTTSANWDTAFSWGNHAGLYLPVATVLAQTKALVAGEFFTSYDASTGLFTSATPNYFTPSTLLADYGFVDNSTNWNTAYTNRIDSLTVTGNSGASTLIANVLNIPTYTLAGLGYTGDLNANNYVHPNHTGDATSVGDGATTVVALRGVGINAAASAPSDGHILVYRTGTGTWDLEVKPVPGGGGATQLSELSDVDSATQTAGFVLASSGANYAGRALIASDIPDLSGSYLPVGTQLPITKALVANEFFTSYNSTTGLFTSAQVAYSGLTGIPSTFAPSAHTHPWSEITSTPTTLAGYGITDAFPSSSVSITGNQIAYGTGVNTIGGSASLTYDPITYQMTLGVNDTNAALLSVYGGAATTGGNIRIYNGATSDTTVDYWRIHSENGALWLEPNSTTGGKLRLDTNGFVTLLGSNSVASASITPGNITFYDNIGEDAINLQGSAGSNTLIFGVGDLGFAGNGNYFSYTQSTGILNVIGKTISDGLNVTGLGTALPTATWSEDFSVSLGDFTTSGDAVWTRVTDEGNGDLFSARSGAIGDRQYSKLTVTKTTTHYSSYFQYDYKTSTEGNFDFLNVYVDGVIQKQYSGTNAWTTDGIFIFGIGSHTVDFVYYKDNNTAGGTDQVWVDNVGLYNNVNPDVEIDITPVFKDEVHIDNNLLVNDTIYSKSSYFTDRLQGYSTTGTRTFNVNAASGAIQQFIGTGEIYNSQSASLTQLDFALYRPDTQAEIFKYGWNNSLYTGGYFQMLNSAAKFAIGQSVTGTTETMTINGTSLFKDEIGIGARVAGDAMVYVENPATTAKYTFMGKTTGINNWSGMYHNSDNRFSFNLRNAAGTQTVLIDSNGSSYFNGGDLTIGTIAALGSTATTFLTHTAGLIQSRTAAQVLSDIGGAASSAIQDWIRADIADEKTTGDLRFNDNIGLTFGSSGGTATGRFASTASDVELRLYNTDFKIKNNTGDATQFTFARTTGDFTATGNITTTGRGIFDNQASPEKATFYSVDELGDNYIAFRTNATTRTAYIGHGGTTTNTFYVALDANEPMIFTTNGTQRMRINAGGNIVIGSGGTDTYKLDVEGDIRATGDITTDAGGYLQTSNSYDWTAANTIGVRMGTPLTPAQAGEIDLRRWTGTGTLHDVALITQTQATGGWGLNFLTDNAATNIKATTTRMYISPTGLVGIGTTAPSYKLDVNGTGRFTSDLYADGGVIVPNNSVGYRARKTTATVGRMMFVGGDDTMIYGDYDNVFQSNLRFFTSGTEKMRINSATGNVSIGGTGNAYKLDVSGTGRFTSTLVLDTVNNLANTNDKILVLNGTNGVNHVTKSQFISDLEIRSKDGVSMMYPMGSTGSTFSLNYYKLATFTLSGQYQNFQERWQIAGRSGQIYDIEFDFEYGVSNFSRKQIKVFTYEDCLEQTFLAVLDNTAKTVTIYYRRNYTDWDLQQYVISSRYSAGATITRENTLFGTTAPTGDEVITASTLSSTTTYGIFNSQRTNHVENTLTIDDNKRIWFGTTNDISSLWSNGGSTYFDMSAGDFYVRDGSTNKFTFSRTTGNFSCEGDITLNANAEYLWGKTSANVATRLHGINVSNLEYIGSIDSLVAGTYIGNNTDIIYFRTDNTNRASLDGGVFQWGSAAAHGQLSWNTNEASVRALASNKLTLGANASTDMTINVSGRVSIGNTNDTYNLDVTGDGRFYKNDAAITPLAIIHQAGSGDAIIGFTQNTNNWVVGIDATKSSFDIVKSTAIDTAAYMSISSTGNVSFAAGNITTTGNIKGIDETRKTIEDYAGTARSVATTDSYKVIRTTSASAVSITVNHGALTNVGEVVEIDQYGAGLVTIVQGTNVLLRVNGSKSLVSSGIYSRIAIQKMVSGATEEYRVFGELA